MSDLWPITSRVLGVFLVMVVGALGRRIGWLTTESDRSLANLTASVLLPSLFFHRIVTSEQFSSLGETWGAPAIGFAFTSLGFVIGAGTAWLIGPWIGLNDGASRRAFALCVGICNYGYIPLPLAEYFYPDSVVTLIVHNVGVDLALWSVGVLVLSGSLTTHWKRAVFSPPLMAVVLAMLVRQTGCDRWIPDSIFQATESLGQCAIPMGLVLSGAIMVDYIKETRWREHLRMVLMAMVLRQGILPALMMGFAVFFVADRRMDEVLLLQAAMPSATFPIVMVRLFDQDSGTALRVVLGTSIFAVLTIPLWLILGKGLI